MEISIELKKNFSRVLRSKPAYVLLAVFVSVVVFAQPVLADSLNEAREFYVDPNYNLGQQKVSASLRQVGNNAYFYIENAWWNSMTYAQQTSVMANISGLRSEFDSAIYPKMTAAYGSEWKPGIDGDNKITILITKMAEGTGGYFRAVDEYSNSQNSSSNEREMIYLNSLYVKEGYSKAFLAHEFQHLISFYHKTKLRNVTEEVWLDEARSEYAATLLGYDEIYAGSNLERRVGTFKGDPSNPLAEWSNNQTDYGAANLFMQYLADHYGERILNLMVSSDKVGIVSVEEALRAVGESRSFDEVFSDWAIANYLNNCALSGHYCYTDSNLSYNNLHIEPTADYVLEKGSLGVATWTKDWSPRWYRIDSGSGPTRNLKISFDGYGLSGNFRVVYILKTSGLYQVRSLELDSLQKGSAVVAGFGSGVESLILIPINMSKRSGFGTNDSNAPFSFDVSIVDGFPVYPDGSLVKSGNDSRVYWISAGTKKLIPSAEIFVARGFEWRNVKVVLSEELSSYPAGGMVGWPDGTLVKSADSAAVYVISSEKRRSFLSAENFIGLGYRWGRIKTLSRQELDQYQTGAPVSDGLHPDGALVKFAGSPDIYLIEGGQKRLIPSVGIFLNNGFSFDNVLNIGASFYTKYPNGPGSRNSTGR